MRLAGEGRADRAVEVHRFGRVVDIHESGPGLADQQATELTVGLAQAEAVRICPRLGIDITHLTTHGAVTGARFVVEIALDLDTQRAIGGGGGSFYAQTRGACRQIADAGAVRVANAAIDRGIGRIGRVIVVGVVALELLHGGEFSKAVNAQRSLGARQPEAVANVAQHHCIFLLDLQLLDAIIGGVAGSRCPRCCGGRLALERVELLAQTL